MKTNLFIATALALLLLPTTSNAIATNTASNDIYVAKPEKAADITAYNEALKVNTVETWNKFLKDYPSSLYHNNALIKRLQLIQHLYENESKGDGSFFDFHGPVQTVTESMFFDNDVKEYRFDKNELVVSGFTRDAKGQIKGYAQGSGATHPSFTREYKYGRVVEFGYVGTPVKSRLSYNDYGLLTKEVIYNVREDAVIGRIEYTYKDFDNHGNWIVREKTVVKNAKEVGQITETRAITYWDETPAAPPVKVNTEAPAQKKAVINELIAASEPKNIAPEFKTLTPEEKTKAIGRKYKEEAKGDAGFFDFHGPVRTMICRLWDNDVLTEYSFDRNQKVVSGFARDQKGHIKGIDTTNKLTKGAASYYKCDAMGKLTSYGKEGAATETQLRYNPYGLINTEEIHDIGSNVIKERSEFSYMQFDDHGNWTERIRTVVKNSKIIKKVTETRKITYWE